MKLILSQRLSESDLNSGTETSLSNQPHTISNRSIPNLNNQATSTPVRRIPTNDDLEDGELDSDSQSTQNSQLASQNSQPSLTSSQQNISCASSQDSILESTVINREEPIKAPSVIVHRTPSNISLKSHATNSQGSANFGSGIAGNQGLFSGPEISDMSQDSKTMAWHREDKLREQNKENIPESLTANEQDQEKNQHFAPPQLPQSERRSSRVPASKKKEEKYQLWLQKLKNNCHDGLEIRQTPKMGRGIFSTKSFDKGEFVVEYAGDLITLKEAKVRDEKYSKNTEKYGSYMYYFVYKDTTWCVDATIESGKYGRLLNHSCKTPNCAVKTLEVDGKPRLIIYAKQDIASGTELIYDYGDRTKSSLQAHSWLAH